MCGKGMPHRVRARAGWQSGALTVFFHEQLHTTSTETTTTVVHKERLCRWLLQGGRTHLKIGFEGPGRRGAKEDLTLASAFPLHTQGAGMQIHILHIQCY